MNLDVVTGLLATLAVALAIVTVLIACFWLRAVSPLWRERRKIRVYPLFEIRHRLVMLAAAMEVDVESEAFQFLYTGTNHLIRDVNRLTLQEMIDALKKDLLNKQVVSQYRETLLHNNPQVRAVAGDLFGEVAKILTSRSTSICLWTMKKLEKRVGKTLAIEDTLFSLFTNIGWRQYGEAAQLERFALETKHELVAS